MAQAGLAVTVVLNCSITIFEGEPYKIKDVQIWFNCDLNKEEVNC